MGDPERATREGYFPERSSLLRHVHSQRAVGLLYGQRALMIGALNPIAFIGTTERSKANDQPWKRLVHTAKLFEAVFFGTREEADRALAFTDRLHRRVRGTIPAAVGPYPAGTAYSAFDPELSAVGDRADVRLGAGALRAPGPPPQRAGT